MSRGKFEKIIGARVVDGEKGAAAHFGSSWRNLYLRGHSTDRASIVNMGSLITPMGSALRINIIIIPQFWVQGRTQDPGTPCFIRPIQRPCAMTTSHIDSRSNFYQAFNFPYININWETFCVVTTLHRSTTKQLMRRCMCSG